MVSLGLWYKLNNWDNVSCSVLFSELIMHIQVAENNMCMYMYMCIDVCVCIKFHFIIYQVVLRARQCSHTF